MTAAGHLHGSTLDARGKAFQVGDDVLCLRNHRRLGVTNGTRATITAINHQQRGMTLATTDGTTVTVPAWYVDAGHLTHGYAITGHKAQGLTCDETFVLGTDSVDREWGYTAMSRGRHHNHLYVVAAAHDPRLPALHDDAAQRLERRLRITRAKTLATDDLDLGLEIA